MPIVTFHPSGKTIEVEAGTLLFDAALRAGLPVASSCSAVFVCGRCNMQVIDGGDGLSVQREPERNILGRHNKLLSDRVSCVTRVQGDCKVTTTYW